jgi:DNA binding domain, excisionase family
MSDNEDLGLLTSAEVAKILRVHKYTVNKMAKAGEIPCIKIAKRYRYSREMIMEFIRENSDKKWER